MSTSYRPAPGRFRLSGIVAVALLATACASTPSPTVGLNGPSGGAPQATPSVQPSSGPAPTPLVTAAPVVRIPQPPDPAGLPVASATARVDTAMPTFSNPTDITNPLFPVSSQASVLMLGQIDGLPFRTEVTLLPETRVIDWQGMRVETLVSQYNAFLDGRITEIAYDFYAQADDGSVWYFGEDVYDFVDGTIVTTAGTWIAGPNSPAAMIMPGQPQVGDVYRPENAPGFVFEEVTVTDVGMALAGPLGPIAGGLAVSELHADGTFEDKLFAPGYGEFQTGGGADVEALAMAVPTDALAGPVPADLAALTSHALTAFEAAGAGDWQGAATSKANADAALEGVRAAGIPALMEPHLQAELKRLGSAIAARDAATTRRAAIETARLAYDLQLRHRPTTEVDLARADLWAAQILIDVAADDAAGVNADVYAIDYLRDRFLHALDPSAATRLNVELDDLQHAVIDDDLATAATAAKAIRRIIADLLPAG